MQDLTIIENELVPVYETSTGEKVVYGTELYERLGSKRQYTDWIKKRMVECDAVENEDFQSFSQNCEKPTGGRPKNEYIIKLDTAKEIAMLERNKKGKQVRRYFIQVEKKYKELSQNPSAEPNIPWFIRKFRGRYIVLERDFIQITGVDIKKHNLFYREEIFTGGFHYDGWGDRDCIDPDDFKHEYGFEYGEDKIMMYLYPCGVRRALDILGRDRYIQVNPGACKQLKDGLDMLSKPKKAEKETQQIRRTVGNADLGLPIQINIVAP